MWWNWPQLEQTNLGLIDASSKSSGGGSGSPGGGLLVITAYGQIPCGCTSGCFGTTLELGADPCSSERDAAESPLLKPLACDLYRSLRSFIIFKKPLQMSSRRPSPLPAYATATLIADLSAESICRSD
ncbi:hypothetical protein ACLKA6_001862 [Drosophila palustris]